MRLASWNLNSVRARMPRLLSWLEEHQPDVICLQETQVADRKFPSSQLAELDYRVVTHGHGGHAGVAIGSRLELDDVVLGIPGATAPFTEARTISVTCNGVRIHTAYAPNGRKVGTPPHAIKLAWFSLLKAWLEIDGLGDDAAPPTILLGDLNIAPLDVDVWEPSRYRKRNLTSPAERQAFADLLTAGLTDCIRDHFDQRAVFTWWNRRSDFYETDRGWRLDHVLANPAAAQLVLDILVDRTERGIDGSSDHAPILVTLGKK